MVAGVRLSAFCKPEFFQPLNERSQGYEPCGINQASPPRYERIYGFGSYAI